MRRRVEHLKWNGIDDRVDGFKQVEDNVVQNMCNFWDQYVHHPTMRINAGLQIKVKAKYRKDRYREKGKQSYVNHVERIDQRRK